VTGSGDVPDPGTITTAYDDADQRTTTTRSGGTDPGTTTHQWDADGNLTDHGQQYDPLGRLTIADASAGGTASYTYNALGQRRTITTGDDITDWSWDINHALPQLAESTSGGILTATHDYTPDGWALSTKTASATLETQWFTHDAQGSVQDTFASTGAFAWRRSYDPWGTITNDVQVTPGATRPSFGYTSAVQDPATMVWHLRARDYNPNLRAFSTPDSVERPTSQPQLSTYGYADIQPALLTDPSGRCTTTYCPPPETPTYCLASGAYCTGPPPVHGPAPQFDVHDLLGLVGIVFPPADALNAVLYASDGDYVNAGVSVLCMVPVAGDALAISRIVRGGVKVGDTGPGVWKAVTEVMSPRAAAYQTRITGRAAGSSYVVGGVKFDGFANGVLLEAKGPGYAKFVSNGQFKPFFAGADALVAQAQRQLAVAGGARIQWSVAEAETATAIKNLFASRGISGILVTHVP
jgi:RHS repeat-associated protein